MEDLVKSDKIYFVDAIWIFGLIINYLYIKDVIKNENAKIDTYKMGRFIFTTILGIAYLIYRIKYWG
jgi:hypothetical protein